jgi:hypothetical protein
MTLPSTYEQALAAMFEPIFDRLAVQLATDPEAIAQIEGDVCEMLVRGDFDRQQEIIKSAEAGDALAHGALLRTYKNLRNVGAEPSKLVEVYYLRHAERGPPNRGRGRHPKTFNDTSVANLGRDITLALLIWWAFATLGLRAPTRNDASEGPSGASVIAAILQRRGMKVREDRLNKIFAKWKPIVTDGFSRWLKTWR